MNGINQCCMTMMLLRKSPSPPPFLPSFSYLSLLLLLRPFTSQPPPPQQGDDLTKRIRFLCASSDVDSALRLLDDARLLGSHRPTSRDLAAVLLALCRSSRCLEAHRRALLALSSSPPLLPDDRTSNAILSNLLRARLPPSLTLRLLRRLLSAKPSFLPSPSVYNRLISHLCSASDPLAARRLLLDMRDRGRPPDTVSYTALLDGLARLGHLSSALQVFDEMLKRGVPPNALTHSALVKAVLRKRMVPEAKSLIEQLWSKMSEDGNPIVNNAAFANVVDALCREGYFHEVFRIAEEMPQGTSVHEEFAYGQMIDSLCQFRRHHGASRIVYIMRKRGFTPSLVSYNCIVHNLSKEGEGGCMRAYQLFEEGMVFGYSLPEPTYKVLVGALCCLRDLQKARDVTNFMLKKDGADKIRIYNVFLSALRTVDDPSEQLNILVAMLQDQCRPDVVTLNTVIHGFCKLGKIEEAMEILNDMMSGKFCPPDVVTFTTVMSGLLDVGKMEEALNMLHVKMQGNGCNPNVAAYNAVLNGLCKNKEIERAVEVFKGMIAKGVPADGTTYTVMISGLLAGGRVNEAKTFWEDLIWPSNNYDDFVYAAILRGLCKLGRMDEACDFLYELVDCGVSPGIVNYNILIDNACKLGLKKEAYQIVGEMRKNGLTPDPVTWRILHKLHVDSRETIVPCNEDVEPEVISEDKCAIPIPTPENSEQMEEAGSKFDVNTITGQRPSRIGVPGSGTENNHVNPNDHLVARDVFPQEIKVGRDTPIPTLKNKKQMDEAGSKFEVNSHTSGDLFSIGVLGSSTETDHMNPSAHPVCSYVFSRERNVEGYLLQRKREPLFKIAMRSFGLLCDTQRQDNHNPEAVMREGI